MKKILFLLAILVFTQVALSQTNYETYGNSRFGYSISYPSLLKPQGEADNGDGQVFKNADAELRVYGSNLLLNETLEQEYNAIVKKSGKTIVYKTLGKDFFVVSSKKNGKISYQKTVQNSDGSFITIDFNYKESKRKIYDAATTKIVKSLKL